MQQEVRDLTTFDGIKLKVMLKENGSKRWLIVTHGMGEHLGRHLYFFKLFAGQFNILLYDLRGHGESGGKPAYVEDFSLFSKDLTFLVNFLKKEFSMKELMLFGHSMGGIITSDFIQNHVSESDYPVKVFLSSPPVGAPGLMGPLFGNLPKFVMEKLAGVPASARLSGVLDIKKLSHDQRVFENYCADPKVHTKVHSKLFFEVLKTAREVYSRPLRCHCPLYVSIGTQDKLVNPGMLIDYFKNVEKNAQLKIIEGAYHEIHNEVDKYRLPYFDFLKQSLS
jgi:acylglycerol lipase